MMHDVSVIVKRNKEQAQKEYNAACDSGDFDLANAIYEANPDVTPLWLQNPNPDRPYDDGGEG